MRSISLPASGQIDVHDIGKLGLCLRLSRDVWAFRFTDPTTGKRQRITLAKYPDPWSGDARDRVDELRKLIARGINPFESKLTERADTPTRTFKA